MEDFLYNILYWLSGQQGRALRPLPTAPSVEDRYKDATLYQNGQDFVDYDIRYQRYPTERVMQNAPYSRIPAHITQSIQGPGDTLYVEVPEQSRFRFRGLPKERSASTKNKKGNEYSILSRRFKAAKKLAMPR